MNRDEYEIQEAHRHFIKVRDLDKLPLAERQEARADFHHAMREDPGLIEERVGWVIAGHYGYGAYREARKILEHKRMNRKAALVHLVAAVEWNCPSRFARQAWRDLGTSYQERLDEYMDRAIRDAEETIEEEEAYEREHNEQVQA